MKTQLRSQVAALFLLAPVAVTFTALPATVLAQPATPEVRSLEVTSDNGVKPGSRLRFRMEGTPRAQASVRIRGIQSSIPLREVERGVYVGRYTVTRTDRVEEGAPIRASLRHGNRTGMASYTVPPGLTSVAVVPPPPQLQIERFQATGLERVEPGSELKFMIDGMPGAVAVVDLPGIDNNVRLREVRPGHYEGSYTIRRTDNLNLSAPVVATLRAGERVVTANLAPPAPPAAGDNRPPIIANLSPREGDTVAATGPTVVSGQFEDRGGSGVDPASVRILLSGRNVTPEAQVTPQSFTYRAALPPGRHTVDVTAKDRAGNAMRRSWSFDVAAGPATVPLQILSHQNNAQVDGGVTHVRGRTAPLASVNVKVHAVPPVVGQFGVAQQVFSQTVQADANGHFDFSFTSPFPVPGTRYDVSMVSSKADVATEARLVLYQRQG
jgi:hypothetical protein